ncbi:Ni/Fe hydrogenase subunit alpha [Rhodobacter maris]|uniref:NAD(P)-dependent nickel-iron dehydrogenase catalytic subunit n=1 Tax=Rhodobacter maris TaxID=446682 RepID=A0A285SRD3_9RHOB|nr:Ni/Fe hydrogenase subunit alpha [Rhodobacter maris]SOC10801.1 NAD(P)-dependent nickel-iron dehydrogenase catalytic subunit [Rhodobacter maris]
MYASRPLEPDSARPESVAPQGPGRQITLEAPAPLGDQGRVTITLDAAGEVDQARLHMVELRGFERYLEGRPIAEIAHVVQRLCGICPVSHHLAAARAMDRLAGYQALTPTAEKLRRLMHYGQMVQSHAVHFYHLAAPDLLFGDDGAANRRAVAEVSEAFPEIATQGVLVRRFGQEVVRAVAGKRGLGGGAVPGGMSRPLTPETREMLRGDVDQVIDWTEAALGMIARLHETNPAFYAGFGTVSGPVVGLVTAAGGADFYTGALRARSATGAPLFDQIAPERFDDVIETRPVPWSDTEFPHLKGIGPEEDWYRVGPLARIQACDLLTSERAEAERQRLLAMGEGRMLHGVLFHHWARLVELLHAAEVIRDLLEDSGLCGHDLIAERSAERPMQAATMIEAPRGMLFHRYSCDDAGRIRSCQLIVPTTQNTHALNAALGQVVRRHLRGRRITETLLGHIERAIRAYDPCLSCATHALGQMPLEVELRDASGHLLSEIRRGIRGEVSCAIPG